MSVGNKNHLHARQGKECKALAGTWQGAPGRLERGRRAAPKQLAAKQGAAEGGRSKRAE